MRIRPAAVAGSFYPADPIVLRRQVDALLADHPAAGPPPRALIAPHAGYVYSGPIAARAYNLVAPLADRIERVLLLGPAHFVPLRGLATPEVDAFATPLGEVPLDAPLLEKLGQLRQVEPSRSAHAREHSLEVQLPFLQRVLRRFTLAPLVVGEAGVADIVAVLECVRDDPATLIVISSDLSHYHAYRDAQAIDARTDRAILALAPELGGDQACGCRPINGLLQFAKREGLRPRQLDLRNSGDTAGDRSRVVGYAAYAFS